MRKVFLGLTLAEQVGWKTIQQLILSELDEHCFQLSAAQWKTDFPFLTDKQGEQLSQWLVQDRITEYEDDLENQGITYFSIVDREYPGLLKEIASPPWLLFARGDHSLVHNPSLAVVGSRKISPYGRLTTSKLIPELVQEGWGIVSGLALGVDVLAHDKTLRNGGSTIAILGSGINVIYPQRHRHYYEQIGKQGLLLSEYPPETPAHPGFFPQRNRIIAGLTYGTIVIEAAKKSGSLITAHHALENGREVFAVPGSIFERQSVGTNVLIQQQGAKLITNVQDILIEFEHISLTKPPSGSSKVRLKAGEIVDAKEQEILELLKQKKMHMNELRLQTSLDFTQLSQILLTLEMKQLIQSLPGSYYQSTHISPADETI